MSQDGQVVHRNQGVGTPQGSCVSPILSNLFLHYAFDKWMGKNFPNSPFVRYADDGVVQCNTKEDATQIKRALEERFKEVGLEAHPDKTHIIHCKQSKRPNLKGEKVTFDFLGYTFKPRAVKDPKGKLFTSFQPAVSGTAKKAMNDRIRRSNVRHSSHLSIEAIAKKWNPILRGWCNYYGKFYPTALSTVLMRFNWALTLWAKRTLKSLRGSRKKAHRWFKGLFKTNPHLFWHWKRWPPYRLVK